MGPGAQRRVGPQRSNDRNGLYVKHDGAENTAKGVFQTQVYGSTRAQWLQHCRRRHSAGVDTDFDRQ